MKERIMRKCEEKKERWEIKKINWGERESRARNNERESDEREKWKEDLRKKWEKRKEREIEGENRKL